jgi:hypothetical protein
VSNETYLEKCAQSKLAFPSTAEPVLDGGSQDLSEPFGADGSSAEVEVSRGLEAS